VQCVVAVILVVHIFIVNVYFQFMNEYLKFTEDLRFHDKISSGLVLHVFVTVWPGMYLCISRYDVFHNPQRNLKILNC
jgi:hypothetical protein